MHRQSSQLHCQCPGLQPAGARSGCALPLPDCYAAPPVARVASTTQRSPQPPLGAGIYPPPAKKLPPATCRVTRAPSTILPVVDVLHMRP